MSYVLLSLALLGIGVVSLRRRSIAPGARAWGWSFIIGGISVILWPEQHGMFFDNATHVPGLGRLINDVCATGSVALQFIFITTLARAWQRPRKAAAALYGFLLASIIVVWGVLLGIYGHSLGYLVYAGYAASPLPVRVWNTIVGFTIPYVCAIGAVAYVRAYGKIQSRYPRWATLVGGSVYGIIGIMYGSLVGAQLVAVWTGHGDIGIRRFLGPIVVVCVLLVVAETSFVLFGPRLLRAGRTATAYARTWFSLNEKQARINQGIERLEQLLNDNLDAAAVANDQRVYLDPATDAALIDTADAHLKAHGLSAYRRKAARQALRYLVLNRASAVGEPDKERRPVLQDGDEDTLDDGIPILDDERLLADLSRQEQEHLVLFADAARIASLVIVMQRGDAIVEGRLTELEPRYEPHGWRREAAALIVEVLRARAGGTTVNAVPRHIRHDRRIHRFGRKVGRWA